MEEFQNFDCEWASCTASFDRKEQIIPHLNNLHMSANHLKTKKSEEELPKVHCKWTACSDQEFETVDDLIKHVSHNHLAMSEEELKSPNLCFWKNCGLRFEDFESLTVNFY
jgi:hypothetical protein